MFKPRLRLARAHDDPRRVTLASLIALAPLLLGLSAGGVNAQRVRQVIVEDQLIVRVPVRPLPPPQLEWLAVRGVQCLKVDAIRGAMLSGPQQVDILLPQQRRVRAHFSADCPALDFYSGFYLKPDDGRLCAGRDSVYSRIGGNCQVQRMQLLMPRLKRPRSLTSQPPRR
jgi:hypothetical protein